MLVKIGNKKLDFNPDVICWQHQSSPLTRFGVWSSDSGPIFVKRFSEKPAGWDLLKTIKGKKLHNTPTVLALFEGKKEYFAFFEWLQGEILSQILQKGKTKEFFGVEGLQIEQKNHLIISIYGTFSNLHRLEFWYPDLDFKNVFISPSKSGFRACLIDLDSCVGFGEPALPDQVSQRYWEGLITTYKEAGKPFLKKGLNEFHRDISAHGRSLNQSMLLLFAYAIQRIGKVPPEAPLFSPMISPQNPISKEVRRLHKGWSGNQNLEKDLHIWLANHLKITPGELTNITSRLTPSFPTGIRSFFSRWLGN
ncbi:MAG: hypothetical protein G3M70_00505 [Candidatus Nitronauta litoralis]|uniref:Protein kinase domain-containing protein n=1 Tax=Candidatus Nitronauta litoralis TaxID=2705533 RepID=A0A7T0BT62_9BACT|nr:MAG: hypothetical protein G3M70_00505 [Candidatus Nitronauta litoralis]